MHPTGDYRLVVRSDERGLSIRVEGDTAAADRQIREVRIAAQKLGIPVRVEPDGRSRHASV